jgi:hypothetical protein
VSDDLNRRDLIRLGAAAVVAASVPLSATLSGQAPATLAFFTRDEFTLVDELSEMIIPADSHSPGARAAKVAEYLDFRLGEAFEPEEQATWKDGLALVDQLSRDAFGQPFMQASADQRLATLTRMAANEGKPERPEERFFAELKARIVRAYYTSEIGLKQEMGYLGNVYLEDFVGTDVG